MRCRGNATGLYPFVEGAPGLAESTLRDFIAADGVPKPPEHLQVIENLPRRSSGEVRSEATQNWALTCLRDTRFRELLDELSTQPDFGSDPLDFCLVFSAELGIC